MFTCHPLSKNPAYPSFYEYWDKNEIGVFVVVWCKKNPEIIGCLVPELRSNWNAMQTLNTTFKDHNNFQCLCILLCYKQFTCVLVKLTKAVEEKVILLPTWAQKRTSTECYWSIQSKHLQVIFRAQVGNRWPSLHLCRSQLRSHWNVPVLINVRTVLACQPLPPLPSPFPSYGWFSRQRWNASRTGFIREQILLLPIGKYWIMTLAHLTYMMTPTDHKSSDRLYPSFFSTSGAAGNK